jgi:predicted RNA-binding protein with PIN domain
MRLTIKDRRRMALDAYNVRGQVRMVRKLKKREIERARSRFDALFVLAYSNYITLLWGRLTGEITT